MNKTLKWAALTLASLLILALVMTVQCLGIQFNTGETVLSISLKSPNFTAYSLLQWVIQLIVWLLALTVLPVYLMVEEDSVIQSTDHQPN